MATRVGAWPGSSQASLVGDHTQACQGTFAGELDQKQGSQEASSAPGHASIAGGATVPAKGAVFMWCPVCPFFSLLPSLSSPSYLLIQGTVLGPAARTEVTLAGPALHGERIPVGIQLGNVELLESLCPGDTPHHLPWRMLTERPQMDTSWHRVLTLGRSFWGWRWFLCSWLKFCLLRAGKAPSLCKSGERRLSTCVCVLIISLVP